MEVTTVSPSPASPTEGDDLCEIDVTSMAIHSVTLLICLCGLAGNGAVLCFLSLKIHNYDIFNLAFADLLLLLFTVPSAFLFLVEDVSCSPIVLLMYMGFLFQLSMISFYWPLFRLTYLDTKKNITYLIELCCHCNPPERLWWLVHCVQYWAFFSLFAIIPVVTFLCPSHKQEHCQAALIPMYTVILLLFVAPMFISCTIKIIKARCGSQQQKPMRRLIVIFLVLLPLLLSLFNFLQQLGYIRVSSHVVFLLACIHSSIKPFIYFLVGRCWSPCSKGSIRLSLQRVFEGKEEKTAGSADATIDTVV